MHDIAFGQGPEFPLVQCRNCNLVYLSERPAPEEISAYYPPDYLPYRKPIQDERFAIMRWARQRNLNQRIKIVEQYAPQSPGSLLDVGCATGIFLDGMRQAGWQVTGLEISASAALLARQRFGLQVIERQLQEAQLPPATFEAITFWDVLEHTFQPCESLQEAHRLLKPGGVLVLTLPNWESLDHRWFGWEWIGFDIPRHLYCFPLAVLEALLEKTGFKLVKTWSGLGGYFTFLASLRIWSKVHLRSAAMRKFLISSLEIPGVRFLFQPFFSLLDWRGVGGTRVVIAWKPQDFNHSD
jgi:SAM-dependent methyltransferase